MKTPRIRYYTYEPGDAYWEECTHVSEAFALLDAMEEDPLAFEGYKVAVVDVDERRKARDEMRRNGGRCTESGDSL